MGYNAPWDFIGRRNEVAFELKWYFINFSLNMLEWNFLTN
jgi:hypothetical protein